MKASPEHNTVAPVMARCTFESGSPAATRRAGERLGRVLAAGDVVLLFGELGAGKTCFVGGVARGLGVARDRRIASPTFAIMNEHPGRVTLHHLDLYRLDEPDELFTLGVAEVLGGSGVTVVEWPERLGRLAPAQRIEVRFAIRGPSERRLEVRAEGEAAARVQAFCKQMERMR